MKKLSLIAMLALLTLGVVACKPATSSSETPASSQQPSSEIVSSDKDTSFESDIKQENNKLVNINSASKDELMTVSGIGESKANNIIEYRTTNGNFKSIEEIKNVSGIGDALFEKIKNSITV